MAKTGIIERLAKERNTTPKTLLVETYRKEKTVLATARALGTTPQTIQYCLRKHKLVIKKVNVLVEVVQS